MTVKTTGLTAGQIPRLSDYMQVRSNGNIGVRQSVRDNQRPLVSVITVIRNAEDTLQRSIDSIRNQTYPNIEYIVVDGASTDGTLSLIERNRHNISRYVSESDLGIYDAFNKGVALATGD